MESPTPEKQPASSTSDGNGGSPLVENQPTEDNQQTQRSNILIFSVLSLVTLTHAFDATCICVTLPVSFHPLVPSTPFTPTLHTCSY